MRSQFSLLALVMGLLLGSLQGATLQEFSGTIKVIRLFKTLDLKAGMELEGKDMIVTGSDGSALIELKDKSTLNIGAGTRFKLSSLKNDGKPNRKVELDLIEGTGLFNVATLEQEGSFIIRTPTAVAGVRGTRFGVRHVKVGRRFVSSVSVIKGRVVVKPVRRQGARSFQRKEVELTSMTQSSVQAGGGIQEPQPITRQEALQLASEAGILLSTPQEAQNQDGPTPPEGAPPGPGGPTESGNPEDASKIDKLFEGVDSALIENKGNAGGPLLRQIIERKLNSVQVVDPSIIKEIVNEKKNQVNFQTLRIPKPPAPPSQTEAQ